MPLFIPKPALRCLVILLLLGADIRAQTLKTIPMAINAKPSGFVFLLVEPGQSGRVEQWLSSAEFYLSGSSLHTHIIECDTADNEAPYGYINKQLNSFENLGLGRCYLIVIGSEAYTQKQSQQFTNELFVNTTRLSAEDSCTTPGCHLIAETDARQLIKLISSYSSWQVDIQRAKEKALNDYRGHDKEKLFEFRLSPSWQHARYDGYVAPSIFTYGLGLSRSFSEHWQLHYSLDFGYSFPDFQEVLQGEVFGQIDQSTLLSGGSQEVTIQETLYGYGYGALGIQGFYRLYNHKGFNPYFGAGLSFMGQLGFEIEIDTTLTIDRDQLQSGGGGFSPGEGDRPDAGAGPGLYIGMRVPLTVGASVYLGERLVFRPSFTYHLDFNAFQPEDYINTFQLSFGISYRFWKKQKKFYHYLH